MLRSYLLLLLLGLVASASAQPSLISTGCSDLGVTSLASCEPKCGNDELAQYRPAGEYGPAACACTSSNGAQDYRHLACPSPPISTEALRCANPEITSSDCYTCCNIFCVTFSGSPPSLVTFVQGEGADGFPNPACSCKCSGDESAFTLCAENDPVVPLRRPSLQRGNLWPLLR